MAWFLEMTTASVNRIARPEEMTELDGTSNLHLPLRPSHIVDGRKDDPDHIEENRAKAKEYSRKYIELLRKKYSKSYKKLIGYKGRVLPWDKLMPPEKNDLLKKDGWDLTPQAFIEYSTLSKKYEKIKEDYPIDKTIWRTDEVFEKLIRSIS